LDAVVFDVAWLRPDGETRQPLAVAAGTAFECVAPVRAFPAVRGQRHFSGFRWSASSGRHVGYESWLERDHAMLLDFDPEVAGYSSQPFGCTGMTTGDVGVVTLRTSSRGWPTEAVWWSMSAPMTA